MSETITSLPPAGRYIDYSAEIPGLESEPMDSANLWADDEGLSFADFIDVINPLQHLPIISSIYRAVTSDEISLGARLLGGAPFGGPIGIIAAGFNAAFEEMSGGNIAEHAAALFEEITGTGGHKNATKTAQGQSRPDTPQAQMVQRQQTRAFNQQVSLEALQATTNARALIPSRQSAHPNLPPTGAPAAWFHAGHGSRA